MDRRVARGALAADVHVTDATVVETSVAEEIAWPLFTERTERNWLHAFIVTSQQNKKPRTAFTIAGLSIPLCVALDISTCPEPDPV